MTILRGEKTKDEEVITITDTITHSPTPKRKKYFYNGQ
jgi:hypothetical protein